MMKYIKTNYNWGLVRLLIQARDYICIIRPQNLDNINKEKPFTDEQHIRWIPKIKDGTVSLKSGNYHFKISLKKLNA